jgi:hypothetical protein
MSASLLQLGSGSQAQSGTEWARRGLVCLCYSGRLATTPDYRVPEIHLLGLAVVDSG